VKTDPECPTLYDLTQAAHQDSKRWFPEHCNDLQYHVLSLVGEAGETANALKKGLRGSLTYNEALNEVGKESIDVFIYLLNIWAILGIDPLEALRMKTELNEDRFGGDK